MFQVSWTVDMEWRQVPHDLIHVLLIRGCSFKGGLLNKDLLILEL